MSLQNAKKEGSKCIILVSVFDNWSTRVLCVRALNAVRGAVSRRRFNFKTGDIL